MTGWKETEAIACVCHGARSRGLESLVGKAWFGKFGLFSASRKVTTSGILNGTTSGRLNGTMPRRFWFRMAQTSGTLVRNILERRDTRKLLVRNDATPGRLISNGAASGRLVWNVLERRDAWKVVSDGATSARLIWNGLEERECPGISLDDWKVLLHERSVYTHVSCVSTSTGVRTHVYKEGFLLRVVCSLSFLMQPLVFLLDTSGISFQSYESSILPPSLFHLGSFHSRRSLVERSPASVLRLRP